MCRVMSVCIRSGSVPPCGARPVHATCRATTPYTKTRPTGEKIEKSYSLRIKFSARTKGVRPLFRITETKVTKCPAARGLPSSHRIAPEPSSGIPASTSSSRPSLPSRSACGCSRRARAALASTPSMRALPAVPAAAPVAPETAPVTHALLTRFAASLVWKKGPSSPLSPQSPASSPVSKAPRLSSFSVQPWP